MANLWQATVDGLLEPSDSQLLRARIPAELRHPEGYWYGLSVRTRMIFYDKTKVANPPRTYEDLADPRFAGKVCTRTGQHVYMRSLLSSMIQQDGLGSALNWAKGLAANRARDPEGGDTDQLRGIVSGECDVALANSYYFVRGLKGGVKDLSDGIDRVGWVFPNQDDRGSYVDISAAGVASNAPHREAAIAFLEYLSSDSAQSYFAEGNNEYPVVNTTRIDKAVAGLGNFKADTFPLEEQGNYHRMAAKVFATVGY